MGKHFALLDISTSPTQMLIVFAGLNFPRPQN